ncbi:MAG: multidrug efflux SMR transporter [Gemmatimonadota bacterium]|nr:multidrug efflux SMR transporter [Gemmatimonadota bacterium]
MAWIYVLVAAAFEVAWAVGLKYSGGLTRPGPAAATVAAMLASFFFLALGVRTLPVGTAYAVWTGIGTAGTAVLGMWLFGEPREALRLGCIVLILLGVAGLRLTSG